MENSLIRLALYLPRYPQMGLPLFLLQRYNKILRPPRIRSKKKNCHRRTTEHEPNRVANSSSQKRAMETASVSHDEEHQHAVISFANGAKVQQNFETAKDLAKKNCLLLHHSAPIAGASARQLMVLHSCLSCLQRKNRDARNCSVRQCAASGLLRPS